MTMPMTMPTECEHCGADERDAILSYTRDWTLLCRPCANASRRAAQREHTARAGIGAVSKIERFVSWSKPFRPLVEPLRLGARPLEPILDTDREQPAEAEAQDVRDDPEDLMVCVTPRDGQRLMVATAS